MSRVFVDTNVLVYTRDSGAGDKQERAEAWMRHLWRSRTGRLSVQVLQEFYTTVTDRLDPGMSRADARADVRALTTWQPLPIGRQVIEAAWSIQDAFGLHWWDAQIVAAAQLLSCPHLLTEDLGEGQEFGDVRVVDPFTTRPDELS